MVLAAAKVGGIVANATKGADFIRENLQIQTNVIEPRTAMALAGCCFFGPVHLSKARRAANCRRRAVNRAAEETNLPYAIAKISGKTMCDAYARQYGFDAFTVMPSNVYGVGDNFHPEHSHVVAGMMRRFHEAELAGDDKVVVWGPARHCAN